MAMRARFEAEAYARGARREEGSGWQPTAFMTGHGRCGRARSHLAPGGDTGAIGPNDRHRLEFETCTAAPAT
jgi:hypothetical protein